MTCESKDKIYKIILPLIIKFKDNLLRQCFSVLTTSHHQIIYQIFRSNVNVVVQF